MANGNDRTPALQNEDWWACLIGWFILLIAIIGVHEVAAGKWAVSILPAAPKLGKWTELSAAFPKGFGATIGTGLIMWAFLCVLMLIAGYFLKFDLKSFIPGFLIIFLIAFISMVIAKQAFISKWGISYVLFALAIGLIISNVFKVPKIIKAAGQTEFFVKIGLVCMGATIMFSVVLKAGVFGVAQALLVATTVWFGTYYICRVFKLSERFSSIIATANAICGVSASIAAGGAVQGDPKEVSYMVAWVLVCAVVLIIVMPPIAVWMDLPTNMAGAVQGDPKEVSYMVAWVLVCAVVLIIVMPPLAVMMNLPTNMAGAWLGGVIDNTGAVIAAGEVLRDAKGNSSAAAVNAAAVVKMAQNVLIGIVAFLMALWATMSLEKKESGERPSLMEVWYRFPKFVIGFMVASLVVSFLVEPVWGAKAAKAAGGACKSYRSWLFALCFVSIGLETDFKELVSVGGGRPAIAYWLSQAANAVWTLFIVWILWSGTFFIPAILPD